MKNQKKFVSYIIGAISLVAACGGSEHPDRDDGSVPDPVEQIGPLFFEECGDPDIAWSNGLRVGICTPEVPNPNNRDTIVLLDGLAGPKDQRVPRCFMKIWEGRGETIRRPPTTEELRGLNEGAFYPDRQANQIVLFFNPDTGQAQVLGLIIHCPIIP